MRATGLRVAVLRTGLGCASGSFVAKPERLMPSVKLLSILATTAFLLGLTGCNPLKGLSFRPGCTVNCQSPPPPPAEERGRQAIALLEGSLTTNNPDLGYASIGMALIYDSESKLHQAAPMWDRALAILKKTGNVNPQVFSNLETRALNFDTAERAQVHQFILDLRQSATVAPQQDQATLYFFNTSGWKVFPEKLTLLDNDKRIAALNREQYVVLPIAPGHHVLRPKDERPTRGSPKHEVDLDAKPGVTYYVAGGFSPNGYSFRWTFAEIPKYEADRLLAEMKPQAQK